jgi:hypothetical protein
MVAGRLRTQMLSRRTISSNGTQRPKLTVRGYSQEIMCVLVFDRGVDNGRSEAWVLWRLSGRGCKVCTSLSIKIYQTKSIIYNCSSCSDPHPFGNSASCEVTAPHAEVAASGHGKALRHWRMFRASYTQHVSIDHFFRPLFSANDNSEVTRLKPSSSRKHYNFECRCHRCISTDVLQGGN